MKRKIIFLDCDGVLNRACVDGDMRYFHPDCFRCFQRIVDRTGADIVISSSWREYNAWYEMLRDFMGAVGIRVIGKTGVGDDTIREEEISKWLLDNRNSVSNWVVIDDWDMGDSFPGHFVHTCACGRIGLDDGFADEAIAILNANEDGGTK